MVPESPQTAPPGGRPFGKYELIKRIGAGGMGEIFLARHHSFEGFEKLMVIKRIRAEHSSTPQFVEMFLREARLAATLNHPNIVQIYDLGRANDQYFLAMEYVNGMDLGKIVFREAQHGRVVPLEHALKILCYVCEALTYTHQKSDEAGEPLHLIHRDVSSDNVLVSFDGGVKLTDFGIARIRDEEKTQRGSLKGKYNYFSPEQVRGQDIDHRADLFALGVLLYRVTTGVLPFERGQFPETLRAIVYDPVPDPAQFNPGFPSPVRPILERALAKRPADRYQDAMSFQLALEDVLARGGMVSNAHLIGRYVGELFGDVLSAQKALAGQSGALSVRAILSGFEATRTGEEESPHSPLEGTIIEAESLVIDTSAFPPETENLARTEQPPPMPPAGKQARTDGDVTMHSAETHVFTESRTPAGSRERHAASWLVPLITGLVVGVTVWILVPRGNGDPASGEPTPLVRAESTRVPPTPGPADAGQAAVDGGNPQASGDSATHALTASAEATASKTPVVASHPRDASKPTRENRRSKARRSASAKATFGFLTINSKPWSEVWFQGKKLGLTPLAETRLPAGRQTLQLVNPGQNLRKTVRVRIEAGQTETLFVTLE